VNKFHLHPKIKAALLASGAAAIVAIANASAGVYPQWANFILLFAGAVAGYLKSA
jgi:hypothetical protein